MFKYHPKALPLIVLGIAFASFHPAIALAQDDFEPMPHKPCGEEGPQACLHPPSAAQEHMMEEMIHLGSGTAWQPEDNPRAFKMSHFGEGGMAMWQGNAYLDFQGQGGPRGRDRVMSQNYTMTSVGHTMGNSRFAQVNAMVSLEPWTMGPKGYSELFQTGESLNGLPLVDVQHPHDLFLELSANLQQRLTEKTWLNFYLAPVGEPVLGPVAYHHRYSAWLNPISPLGHHSQDATHVSFGVLTAGIQRPHWQLEASLFNGKEPDENRRDFDFGPLTSWATRLTVAPNAHWTFQASQGFLDDPDRLEPGDVHRLTASAQYQKTWPDGWFASTLALGHNLQSGPNDNSVLLEATVNFKERNYVFSRVENLQRHGLIEGNEATSWNLTAVSLGLARDISGARWLPLQLGAMVTMYAKPQQLEAEYGSFPVAFSAFLRTSTPKTHGHHMGRHPHHHHA